MAKRKLMWCGRLIAICEEAILNEGGRMRQALFHPRMNELFSMAGYAPYWITEWDRCEKVEDKSNV